MFLGELLMTAEDVSISNLKDPRLWTEFGITATATSSGQTVTPDTALGLSAY